LSCGPRTPRSKAGAIALAPEPLRPVAPRPPAQAAALGHRPHGGATARPWVTEVRPGDWGSRKQTVDINYETGSTYPHTHPHCCLPTSGFVRLCACLSWCLLVPVPASVCPRPNPPCPALLSLTRPPHSLTPLGGREQSGDDTLEFTQSLRNTRSRLVEARSGHGDLRRILALEILGWLVDGSATDTGGLASGPQPWHLLYPMIGVDLSVPRAASQCCLLSWLSWPERTSLLRTMNDQLKWSQTHCSSPAGGNGMHADVLAWSWLSNTRIYSRVQCARPATRAVSDLGLHGNRTLVGREAGSALETTPEQ
jgi:hypothetical protein